jgi:hypothetical protein
MAKTPILRQSRDEYLNALLTSLAGDQLPDADAFDGGVVIQFKPFHGWCLCGPQRWIGDDGCDFLGSDWKAAEIELKYLFPPKKGTAK